MLICNDKTFCNSSFLFSTAESNKPSVYSLKRYRKAVFCYCPIWFSVSFVVLMADALGA
jgi:hypothetical protein